MNDISRWLADLHAFAAACDGARREDEGQQVRAAQALLLRAPAASSFCPELMPPAAAIQSMLAAGAALSAGLALLSPGTGIMLSKGGDGAAMASVSLPGGVKDFTASGETLSLALLAALARALIAEGGDEAGIVQRLDRGAYRSLN